MDEKKLISAEVRIRISSERKEVASGLMEKIKNVPGIKDILPPKHIIALTESLTPEQIVALGKRISQIPEVFWVTFNFFPEEQKYEKH